MKKSDFIFEYHAVVPSDFRFLPNAELWLKWTAIKKNPVRIKAIQNDYATFLSI